MFKIIIYLIIIISSNNINNFKIELRTELLFCQHTELRFKITYDFFNSFMLCMTL